MEGTQGTQQLPDRQPADVVERGRQEIDSRSRAFRGRTGATLKKPRRKKSRSSSHTRPDESQISAPNTGASSDGASRSRDNSRTGFYDIPSSRSNGRDSSSDEFAQSGFVLCEPSVPPVGVGFESEVDIIAVAAVGAHPINTWLAKPKCMVTHLDRTLNPDGSILSNEVLDASMTSAILSQVLSPSSSDRTFGAPWVTHDIRRTIPSARVLVYNHGEPQDGCVINNLALKLLDHVTAQRRGREKRPLFFIAHSTGGLVVKAALIKAQEAKYKSIGHNCYGVTFFATPHKGSSYLSSPLFNSSIGKAMNLIWPVPRSLQKQLMIHHPILTGMSDRFMPVAAELNVWTFYEARDTNLADPNATEAEAIAFSAPITSIKSAILGLHHEVDRPLMGNHAECARFGGDSDYTKWSYMEKLNRAVKKSLDLCNKPHTELTPKQLVHVEVHGFYEATDNEAPGQLRKIPIRLWSTKNRLVDFLDKGPAGCISDRLKESYPPPEPSNHLKMASSRQKSWRVSGQTTNSTLTSAKPSAREIKDNMGTRKAKRRSRGNNNNLTLQIQTTDASRTRRRGSGSSHVSTSSIPNPPPINTEPPTSQGLQETSVPLNVIPPSPTESGSVGRTIEDLSPKSGIFPRFMNEDSNVTSLGISSSVGRVVAHDQAISSEADVHGPLSNLLSAPEPSSPSEFPVHRRMLSSESDFESDVSGNFTAFRLKRPNISNQILTWVHLPFNNPIWVSEILARIATEKGNNCHSELLTPRNWAEKHIWGKHSEYHSCFVKSECKLLSPHLEPSSPHSPKPEKPLSIDLQMSLFLPYLHWDAYKCMVRRRDIIKERIAQGRSRPTPPKLDLENMVAWRYLGYDPPFNGRRTLDQYGYPNIQDTRARDDDQMLYKMTKILHFKNYRLEKGEDTDNTSGDQTNAEDDNVQGTKLDEKEKSYDDLKDGKVLMVDQLWLWIVDNTTTFTCFPQWDTISMEGRIYQQTDLRNSIYNEVNADLSRRCENALDLAALVTLHAVTLLFERSSHRDLEVFRIFEESISILVEKMTKSFKYFRAKGFRAIADEEESDEEAHSIKERHKEEGKQFQEQIRDNVSALLELRDINDELQTLKKLFEQQQEAVNHMLLSFERCGHGRSNGCSFLHEAQLKLKDYLHQIHQMTDSAERTKGDFEKLLDLVQRQANVDEARLSRWQADLQSSQSRSVMIFTVFTIIFLPLTFFTGLFGMNTSEWAGTSTMPSISSIAAASLPISFIIIVCTLTAALSTRARRWAGFAGEFITRPFEVVEAPAEQVTPQETLGSGGGAKSTRRRHLRLRRYRREHEDMNEDDETDFWKEHREKQDKAYEIPWQNRRPSQPPAKKRRKSKMGMHGGTFKRGLRRDDALEKGKEKGRDEEKVLV